MKSRKLVAIHRVTFLTRKQLQKWSKSKLITCILKMQARFIKRAVVSKVKHKIGKKRRSAKQKAATRKLVKWNKSHR